MTEQWGAPLTGEQMKLLRDAGLKGRGWQGNQNYLVEHHTFSDNADDYHLPADHPAYTLLEKGWLDIPNARLWFGGEKAPDDLGSDVTLLRSGKEGGPYRWDHFGHASDIIAYFAKVEASYPADGGLKDQVRDPSECQSAFQTITETVTLNKMTLSDIDAWIAKSPLRIAHNDAKNVFAELGLIKPETTLEERFWQGKERNSLSQDGAVKALVREALNFERSD